MKIHAKSRNDGFSLLEVLIAVVIMSVGLLALATLQLGVVRSSAEAKAQTVAVNVARDKLEDLVSYKVVNEASGVACPSANDSYQCLTTNLVGDTFTGDGGAVFTRTWTVDRCVGNQATGAFTCGQANTAAWTAAVPRNEFKTITVSVNWTDATGAQTLVVKDAISALNPSDIALVQKVVKGLKPRPAIAKIWDPGTVSGVIPIAVGNGTSSAATNPKPEVIVGNSVVETRFDVLTYAGLSGGAADAQARVETAIVGCTCSFATLPTTDRGLRPSYWDGTRYSIPVPTAAAPPARAATGVTQSENCDICCRDHHDPTGTTTAKFSPFLSTHGHYNANTIGTVAVTAGNYKEACRLIRVEGVFRTAADMNNDYFALLATKDLNSASNYGGSSIPDTTATASYQQFVVDYMNTRFTNVANPAATSTASQRALYNSYHSTNPCVSGSCTLENETPAAVARTPTLNAPSSINIGSSDVKWNHSRGLFVDYLEPEAIQVITNAKTNCLSPTTDPGFSNCVLKYLPFTSINLTEIADWSSPDTTQVVVTNNDYSDSISANDPVRGKTMWGTTPVTNSSVNVSSKSRKSNSGLLDLSFEAISYDDSIPAVDSQPFIVQGTNGNPGQNGAFKVILSGPSGSTPAVTYITGVQNSQACNAGNGQNVLTNTCSVTNANSGSGLGVPNSMKVVALNYNAQVDGQKNGATTTANQVTCYDATGMNPLAVPSGEKYTEHTCKNYAVSSATLVSSGGVAGPAGALVSSGVDATLSEKTIYSFPLINNGDIITMTFGTPTTSSPALTCSYATQQNGNINYTVTQADCAP